MARPVFLSDVLNEVSGVTQARSWEGGSWSLKNPPSPMPKVHKFHCATCILGFLRQWDKTDFQPWQCCMSTTCTKLTYLKLWTSSLRNTQDACSWTVCCSTDFDILGLSKYCLLLLLLLLGLTVVPPIYSSFSGLAVFTSGHFE